MNLAFIYGIGPLELCIVLAILLLVLGPKRLPGIGRSLGSGLRELRASVASRDGDAAEADKPSGGPGRHSGAKAAGSSIAAIDEHPLEGEVVPERR